MSINSDVTPVRAPRIRAQINGEIIDSVMHMNLTAEGSFKSSHFDLTVCTSVAAAENQWLNLLSSSTTVKILMRLFRYSSETVVFEGLVDNVAFDPLNNVASIRGRDYSSTLINSTYQMSFGNQTASEIAATIAQRHGFLQNITETPTLVGSYQNDNYNQVLLNVHSRITSEWDLLTYLAKTEDFELFVDGTTLVFSPLGSLHQNRMKINKNVAKDIKFERVCPLSNNSSLIVKSWNSWQSQVSLYANNQSTGSAVVSDTGLNEAVGTEIAIIRPNLTPQDAEELSQRCLNSLMESNINVEISMPGEMTLKPRDIISVSGSNTSFDSDYIVRTVRRQFSSATGFVQHVLGFAPGTSTTLSSGPVIS